MGWLRGFDWHDVSVKAAHGGRSFVDLQLCRSARCSGQCAERRRRQSWAASTRVTARRFIGRRPTARRWSSGRWWSGPATS